MYGKTNLIASLAVIGTLLLTAGIYWQGLNGPFLLDDFLNIVEAHVESFSWPDIHYAITHNESGMLGRPVSIFSLVFTGIVHGLEPWGYKFHNLIIHLVNGLLIFWLLLRLLPRLSPSVSRQEHLFVAGIVMAAWLLHPLLVSTVLYAVQRMAQLATLFTLVALLVYSWIRDYAGKPGMAFHLLAWLLFPLSVLLAVFSKENGALIPFYIVAMELTVYQFSFADSLTRKRLAWFLGTFVVAPVSLGLVYMFTHMERFANFSLRDFTMLERLMTELHVVAMYLKMILLPRLSDMTLFHDYFPVTRSFDFITALLLACLAILVFLVFFLRKRAPVAAFAIAWFLVSHLLESTILNLELMFEHRNYLAAVGPIFGMVYYLCRVPGYPQLKYLNAVFLLLVIFLTFGRVQEWRSRELIYQVALAEHPDSYRVRTEMATVNYQSGNLLQAVQHLDAAMQLKPTDFGPVLHQAIFLCGSGNDLTPHFAEARQRAASFPVTVYALNSLDNAVSVVNNGACPEISYEMLLELVATAKGQAGNQTNGLYMGFLEKIEGQINLYLGNYQKGMGLLLMAYEHTGMVRILVNMAEILLYVGRLGEAEQIINYIAELNREAMGAETAVLEPLQQALAQARSESP